MEKQIKLSTGDFATARDVMIEIDHTNLEEGVDVHFNDEPVGTIIGMHADDISAEVLEDTFNFY